MNEDYVRMVDRHEWELGQVKGDVHELKTELKSMSKVLVGILISTATAAILLAVNLVVAQ